MDRQAAPSYRRRGAVLSGIIAALVFNACAIVLPVSGAAVATAFANPDIVNYAPTPSTLDATRRALDAELSRFASSGLADRREAWNNLIAREMAENDVPAARGFALAAPKLLSGGDVAKIRRLSTSGDEQSLIAAALPLIEPVYARQRFRAVMNRRDDPGAFDVLSDASEVARTAERWLVGDQIDLFLLSLSGATLITAGPDASHDDVRLGASVVKIARNGAKLTPGFKALIEQRLAAAVPPEKLKAALADAFQNREAIVDEEDTVVNAFNRAIDRPALEALKDDLALIGAAARAAAPSGAAMLLAQAHNERDLRRIRLLAVAGGDKAVAVAKRSASGLAIEAAKGAIMWDQALVSNIIAAALAALGLIFTAYVALAGAVRREWDDAPPSQSIGSAALSKADAQRRARENQPAGRFAAVP